MTPPEQAELVLLRHAPADHGGRLVGRTDVPALLPDAAALVPFRRAMADHDVVSSPARRCRETARALFPDAVPGEDARLWEQDFGRFDGAPFADLPDLGHLSVAALARHRYEGGESFLDLCARVGPALRQMAVPGAHVAIVAHAGTVRAGLALALSDPADALAFEVAPLSMTRLRFLGDEIAIRAVNAAP